MIVLGGECIISSVPVRGSGRAEPAPTDAGGDGLFASGRSRVARGRSVAKRLPVGVDADRTPQSAESCRRRRDGRAFGAAVPERLIAASFSPRYDSITLGWFSTSTGVPSAMT